MMPLDDAKMVVVPAATPVARPAAFMVATEAFDDAHHFMAGDDVLAMYRQIAFRYVEVGAAYAAGLHAYEDFARRGFRWRDIDKRQRMVLDRPGNVYRHRFHVASIGRAASASTLVSPSRERT